MFSNPRATLPPSFQKNRSNTTINTFTMRRLTRTIPQISKPEPIQTITELVQHSTKKKMHIAH
jgi:hypothetical protein